MNSDEMKYKLTHTTSYVYSEPVAVSHNQVHLEPRSLPRQQCHQYDVCGVCWEDH